MYSAALLTAPSAFLNLKPLDKKSILLYDVLASSALLRSALKSAVISLNGFALLLSKVAIYLYVYKIVFF